jgi:twitching motility protein PilT
MISTAPSPQPLTQLLTQLLAQLLQKACDQGASDLHLSSGLSPRVRINGELVPLYGCEKLTHETLMPMLMALMDAAQVARFKQGDEVDFSFATNLASSAVGRFRANVFMQQLGCAAVMRHIPDNTPTLADLHAPKVLTDLLAQVGLLLVTGPTGSGKSTTLAAMVQHLNTHTQQHIVTLEDPIEFMHASDKCLITQREIGTHSHTFGHALRAVLREDPDVILVGELRDLDTIRLALTAAETGHLVLASLHTRNAAATIERIVDVFEAQEKSLIRTQLSDALLGVFSQTLCPTPSGSGRHAVFETLVATPAVRHLIRENKSAQIQSAMQTGAQHGMQTHAQAMQAAEAAGWVTFATRAQQPIPL